MANQYALGYHIQGEINKIFNNTDLDDAAAIDQVAELLNGMVDDGVILNWQKKSRSLSYLIYTKEDPGQVLIEYTGAPPKMKEKD